MDSSSSGLDISDPFVCLLMCGGFLYLNEVYDIVAVNSFFCEEVNEDTAPWLNELGYTDFALVCPSEILGDWVSPTGGGFAYLSEDKTKSLFAQVGDHTPSINCYTSVAMCKATRVNLAALGVCVWTCVLVCEYVCGVVRVLVCVFGCVYVCVCGCGCVCVCVWVCGCRCV